jgi:hypothetical protein
MTRFKAHGHGGDQHSVARRRRGLLTSLLLVLALACGGIGLAYEHDLTSDYAIWAPDANAQAAVVQKIPDSSSAATVIGPMVFRYGWNAEFIIAQQHPVQDGFDELNTGVTHWFILEVATGKVHGPLTEAAYIRRHQTLGVPDDLDFTHTIKR